MQIGKVGYKHLSLTLNSKIKECFFHGGLPPVPRGRTHDPQSDLLAGKSVSLSLRRSIIRRLSSPNSIFCTDPCKIWPIHSIRGTIKSYSHGVLNIVGDLIKSDKTLKTARMRDGRQPSYRPRLVRARLVEGVSLPWSLKQKFGAYVANCPEFHVVVLGHK
jgi:hypothetical protein